MGYSALHRLRQNSRRIAAAAVAVFALNWLGLALMPCAMAYALPGAPAAVTATETGSQPGPGTMPEGCAGHPGAATAAPSAAAAAPLPLNGHEPCAWCLDAGSTGSLHDAGCGATPKPALDSRDSKTPVAPLLLALSATVLGIVPLESTSAAALVAAAPVLPPETPAADRYCRRLE